MVYPYENSAEKHTNFVNVSDPRVADVLRIFSPPPLSTAVTFSLPTATPATAQFTVTKKTQEVARLSESAKHYKETSYLLPIN